MIEKQAVRSLFSRAVIVIMAALALSATGLVASAHAATYDAGNGWVLNFDTLEGGVSVTGAQANGQGALAIPDKIDGADVVEIGKEAFYQNASLGEVSLPDTLATIGEAAFMGSGLSAIRVPASVGGIPRACFSGCQSLSSVEFAGDSIGYFGELAFAGCTALKELVVPELTEKIPGYTYRIGPSCFYGCYNSEIAGSGLETIIFDGDLNTPSSSYLANSDCFDISGVKSLVWRCQRSSIPSGTATDSSLSGVNEYQTLWFYANEDDLKAGADPVYHITCLNSVKVLDAISGDIDESKFTDSDGKLISPVIWERGDGEKPVLEDDMAWGVANHAIIYSGSAMADTYGAAPVKPANLGYAWIGSEIIDEFEDNPPTYFMYQNYYPVYYISDAGKVDNLDGLVVYGADAKALDSELHELKYQQIVTTTVNRVTNTTYVDLPGEPTETGTFRVRAVGAAGTAAEGTETDWVTFFVRTFTPTVELNSGKNVSERLGKASQKAAEQLSGAAKCDVVVPASDWRYHLIGAGLAGVGNGVVLYDNKDDYSNKAATAFATSGANSVQVLGSTKVVPESAKPTDEVYLVDFLYERSNVTYKTRYSEDSTPQKLADQVYTTIRRLQNRGQSMYGDGWGTTAIVASPSKNMDTLAIAQYAYEQKAPVFFVSDNGLLSSAELGFLSGNDIVDASIAKFDKIVVAGDKSYVSDACLSQIQSATGIAPERVFDGGNDSLGAVMGSLDYFGNSTSNVVIAGTEKAASVTAGAVLAGSLKGTLFTCSCSADSKKIQEYLRQIIAEKGQSSVKAIYLVGDFSTYDSKIAERFKKMWSAPMSTAVGEGDTVEAGDYVYGLQSGGKASFVRLRNTSLSSVNVKSASYSGKSYSITSVGAGAFDEATALTKVTLASAIKTVGASAFSGCTSLKSVSLPSVTSLGDSAFVGCTALTSAKLPKISALGDSTFAGCVKLKSYSSKKVKSIGESAFEGCAKLAKATFSASGLKTVGENAFNGCKKLKSLTFKTKKLTAKKVGATAFKGMPKSAKVYVPKSKVKAYTKVFRKKGLPKKATIQAA